MVELEDYFLRKQLLDLLHLERSVLEDNDFENTRCNGEGHF